MTILPSVLRALVFCAAATVLAFGQSTHYSYTVNTVAGDVQSGDGGSAVSAVIEPYNVVAGPGGVFYIGESSGWLRKVLADGTISTIARLGSGIYGLAVDASGNVYAGTDSLRIYRIPPGGQPVVIAGGGNLTADGIAATSAFVFASSLIAHPDGRLLLADYLNNRIRAIDKAGIITTVAGTGSAISSGDGGPAILAGLNQPFGITLDGSGNIYVGEWGRIRKIGTDGVIKTIAGNGNYSSTGEFYPAARAEVSPYSLTVDPSGNLYFCESGFGVVRKIGADGYVLRVVGTYEPGFSGDGGVATGAMIDTPMAVSADSAGNVLVADFGNARVRRLGPGRAGVINTVAGKGHFAGDGGQATGALLFQPTASVYDDAGTLYIADYYNRRIRRVSASGVIDTVAGNGHILPPLENVLGPLMAIGSVTTMAVDPGGNLVFGSLAAVRKLDRASGKVTTFAGDYTSFGNSGDGGRALQARFGNISGLAWDKDGNLYIADSQYHRVRRITTDGTINGFAGGGRSAQDGDGGPAISAGISSPTGLALDSQSNLYILSQRTQIRRVSRDGTISTVLKQGVGDLLDAVPRPVSKALIPYMTSIAVDSTDTLYFSFAGGIGATKNGLVWLVGGQWDPGFAGDGGIALNARLGHTIYLTARGRTLVAGDTANHRVRVLSPLDPKLAEITGGNNQTGVAGAALQTALSVRVSGAGGLPAALVPVTFAVTAGSGSVGTASAMTDATGTAQTTLTPGDAGTIKVSATVAGLPVLEFTATATTGQVPGTPSISEGGITGAALSVPPVRSVSPNAIVTVWGSNFIAAGTQRRLSSEDLVNGRIPTKLGGICVDFDGQRAPIFDVYPSQLNIQVPAVSGTSVSVRVLRNCGEATESASVPAQVNVAASSPEFFAFSSRVDGHVPVAARHHPSNVIVGPSGAYGEPSEPAQPGSIVTVYGTGFGLTTPDAFAPGELPDKAASPGAAPVVTLGGVTLAPVNVLYVGVTPGNAGLYQLNIRVPESMPDGEQPLILRLGAASTPSGPYLLIRRSGGSNTQ